MTRTTRAEEHNNGGLLSEQRVRRIAGADRKMVRDQPQRPADTALWGRPRDLSNEWHRIRYRRLLVLLRCEGESSGIRRIYRLSGKEGLMVLKRNARHQAIGTRAQVLIKARADALVAGFRFADLRFGHDPFACGRRFRVVNLVDDVTREDLAAIPFAIGLEPKAA